jgi:hypothetical protein
MTIIEQLTDKDLKRFWSKVDKRGENDCWEWRGCKTAKGAGIFCASINNINKSITAHHVSYYIVSGIDAFDKPMEKYCNTIGCCNPNHYGIKIKKTIKDFKIDEKFMQRFWKKVRVGNHNGCWEWMASKDYKGYGQFSVNGKSIRSHRISYMIKNGIGSIPSGMSVCHSCDNRLCCNPKHLFLGTYEDNNHDRHKKGRDGSAKGEAHGAAKLNNEKVLEIRYLLQLSSLSRTEIAKLYSVSKSTINRISTGEGWKNITI